MSVLERAHLNAVSNSMKSDVNDVSRYELSSIKAFVRRQLYQERRSDCATFVEEQRPEASFDGNFEVSSSRTENDALEDCQILNPVINKVNYKEHVLIKSTGLKTGTDKQNSWTSNLYHKPSVCEKHEVKESIFASQQLHQRGGCIKTSARCEEESKSIFVSRQLHLGGVSFNFDILNRRQECGTYSHQNKAPSFLNDRMEISECIDGDRYQGNLSGTKAPKSRYSLKSINNCFQRRGIMNYCIFCESMLPNENSYYQHINSQKHKFLRTKYRASLLSKRSGELQYFAEWKSNETSTNVESVSLEIKRIYQSDLTIGLTYFLNKICIFQLPSNNNQYTCCLCKQNNMSEEHSYSHVLDDEHITRVTEVIQNCDPMSVSFEISISLINNYNAKCFLCNKILPINNPINFNVHLQTKRHENNTRAHFRSSRFQFWEKGIILRDGCPYCVFCQVILPSEVSMQKHVTNPVHKCKL